MARYFIRYPFTASGLSPTFTYFNNATTFAPVTPPSILEVNGVGLGAGSYYFDYVPTFEIVWLADGTAAITDDHDRYVPGRIGPVDAYLDEPISQVADDVWEELITAHQTAGSTGKFLNDIFRLLKNKGIINPTTKTLDIYNDAGSSIIFSFDLKDENGVASAFRIFQRLPV